MAAGNWADLPEDLLISVVDRLVSTEVVTYFGGVCTSWRRAASAAAKKAYSAAVSSGQQLPWLMTIQKSKDDEPLYVRAMIDSLEWRDSFMIPLPHYHAKASAVRSSLGWIFTSYSNNEARLFHPISGSLIEPPSLSSSNISPGIVKFVLSALPSTSTDYKAIIIHDHESWALRKYGFGSIAFWAAGDAAWTSVEVNHTPMIDDGEQEFFSDMVYRQGRVFAIPVLRKVLIFNIDEKEEKEWSPTKRVTVERVLAAEDIFIWEMPFKCSMMYVALSEGAVLVVEAVRKSLGSFRVFEWAAPGWEGSPRQVLSLGGRALFLSNNSSSFTVKASDYENCEADCIYFAHNFRMLKNSIVSDSDVGIFRLQDGSSELSKIGNRACLFPPFWFQPTVNF